MYLVLRKFLFVLLIILCCAPFLSAQKVFLTYDISPDPSNFTASDSIGTAGRIMSLVIDPNNDRVLYAASELAGVWKSTTGATWVLGSNGHTTASSMEWSQASVGLRSGLTVNNHSLAVDGNNSQRLLYATADDDGRPNEPLGGLWVSINAAGAWSHETPCGTSTLTSVASVAFANGQPYVSTACGVMTTTNANLHGGWTTLPVGTNAPSTGAMVIDGGFGTLFACSGNQILRATDAGASGNWQQLLLPAGAGCFHISAVPNGGSASTTVLAIWGPTPSTACGKPGSSQEVSVLNFATSTIQNLNYAQRPQQPCPAVVGSGSGSSVVATPAIKTSSGATGPGVTYDVYAADGCAFYSYNRAPASWAMLAGPPSSECNSGTTNIHVDTWAMAFPSWYDPGKGFCAAYAATDGGVYFSGGLSSTPVVGGCISGWGQVQHHLHVIYGNAVWAVTAGSTKFTTAPLAESVYLPTGDNDTFVTTFGWKTWQSLPDGLGDSAQVLVDPAFPVWALASRNSNYTDMNNPAASSGVPMVPSLPATASFDNGNAVTGTADLTQVMTTSAELATPRTNPDYLTVLDQDVNCTKLAIDEIVRNRSNPPVSSGWTDDISPSDHFNACNIGKIQSSGGHAPGSLTIYVLTAINGAGTFTNGRGPGLIYKGVTDNTGHVTRWESASGTSPNVLQPSDNFFVNPYNPNELYASSTAGSVIQYSRDGGANWNTDATLSDIATNHGEYRIGCEGSRTIGSPDVPWVDGCSLSGMAFDIFSGNIRVAAMFYGGIAFSRDAGKDWMALDITDNNHFVSANLTQIVTSVFFDAETHGKGSKKLPIPGPDQRIYYGLKGQGIRMAIGPFLDLESLDFTYTPKTSLPVPSNMTVQILTKGLAQKIALRLGSDGLFRGSMLFDHKTASTIQYQYLGDGPPTALTHALSTSEITAGVAKVSD